MSKRFVTIWFCYLKTDWLSIRRPGLQKIPFVLVAPIHGRMIITASNPLARLQGIETGMVLADAKIIQPSLLYFDDLGELPARLLNAIGRWCIRFTPVVAVDLPDSLILDVSGCAHLWGSEILYLNEIVKRLKKFGYHVHASIADTIGAAWAVTRFGNETNIIHPRDQANALLSLPPEALRLEPEITERLHKLGLRRVKNIINMSRIALRRRFGNSIIQRLGQALGYEEEKIEPVEPIEPYQERLHCLEPVVTATAIEIALQRVLETMCNRLKKEQKGIRKACFRAYRVDGKLEKIEIGTNRASQNAVHLFKLFELKIPSIEPQLGIELFILEAIKIEDVVSMQEKIWEAAEGLENTKISELIDRLENKIGHSHINRYLPDEHHWPERSVKQAVSLEEKPGTQWRSDKLRPIHLLSKPEPIGVAAPIPDYPPMLFRYKNKLHKIIKADGPERIEREWWVDEGLPRDYYCVEDEDGNRYWLFRSGHYNENDYQWFIHGFFA